MPDFYEKMKNKLRTVDQGADTIIWLAISLKALGKITTCIIILIFKNILQHHLNTFVENTSGLFFQDRTAVPTHLPLAWTKSSAEECEKLMTKLNEISRTISF